MGGGSESEFFVDGAFSVSIFIWVDLGNVPGALAMGPDKVGRKATQNSHSTISFKLM